MTIITPPVFEAERAAGLEHKIVSDTSIAFVSQVASLDAPGCGGIGFAEPSPFLLGLSKAAAKDPDVYNVFSILVSTVWNLNDDIFNKADVWEARNTPKHKPTNVNHDEKQIVGGIVDSWPIDADLNLIKDSDPDNPKATADLPDLYHILVSSVIYRQWQDPELKARAEELIQQIEAGEMFVSMECIFRGFDYGVVDPGGNNHIVARSADTSFLSQHLRAYGGKGTFQDHKIGRVLRNITFSGKGFVDKPANPGSIIFDKDHIFSFANASQGKSLFLGENGVNNNEEPNYLESKSNEENKMSQDLLNEQVKELKEGLASLKAENKELTNKLATANVSQYEDKIAALEADVTKFEATISELETELTEANDKATKAEEDLSTKSEELDKMQASFDKMKEEEKKKKRQASLIEAGLSTEEADAKLEALASLSDEQFDVVVKTVSELKPAATESTEASEETEASSEESEEEETEASEVVEEEEESTSMASESEDGTDELSTARAGLASWVETVIMKQQPE